MFSYLFPLETPGIEQTTFQTTDLQIELIFMEL